jgi:hypothetical protein
VGAVTEFHFAGRDGVQLDFWPTLPNSKLFGGPDGDFAIEPAHPLRLGIVSVDEELLFVMCLGKPDTLDDACDAAQPILDSVSEVTL